MDDLLKAISNQYWPPGESHKFSLDKYGISNGELPIILQNLKEKGLDYELHKRSGGKSTLRIYKRSNSSVLKDMKQIIGCLFGLLAMFFAGLISVPSLVLIYPFLTVTSKLLDGQWIPLNDFCDSYWAILFGEENL